MNMNPTEESNLLFIQKLPFDNIFFYQYAKYYFFVFAGFTLVFHNKNSNLLPFSDQYERKIFKIVQIHFYTL